VDRTGLLGGRVGALAARYGFAASYGGGGGKEEEEEVRRRFASGVGSAVRVQGARMWWWCSR